MQLTSRSRGLTWLGVQVVKDLGFEGFGSLSERLNPKP